MIEEDRLFSNCFCNTTVFTTDSANARVVLQRVLIYLTLATGHSFLRNFVKLKTLDDSITKFRNQLELRSISKIDRAMAYLSGRNPRNAVLPDGDAAED